MNNNVIPITGAQAPAAVRQRQAAGRSITGNFSSGVTSSFPVISVRGKVFRARVNGVEQAFIDPNTNQPIPALDVVMVNAGKQLAKAYYIKGFDSDVGSWGPPDCWSLDSVRPDPSVANKVNPTCGDCPMNAFGSRITPDGKRAKACQDARRVAVMMPHHLNTADPMVFMLRVAQSSLNNLKAYSELLERHGFEPNACVTRITFDYQEAYPKLLFNFVSPLDDQQYNHVELLAEGDFIRNMLTAPDFQNAPSVQPKQNPSVGGLAPQPGPVLQPVAAEPGVPAPTFQPTPQEVIEKAALAPELLETPDGWLNVQTGEITPFAEPQEPDFDPMVVKTSDGRYFHRELKAFVTGPERGAKPVAKEEPKTAKPPRKKREETVKPGPTETVQEAVTESSQPTSNGAEPTDIKPIAQAAPQSLENALLKLRPNVDKQ